MTGNIVSKGVRHVAVRSGKNKIVSLSDAILSILANVDEFLCND